MKESFLSSEVLRSKGFATVASIAALGLAACGENSREDNVSTERPVSSDNNTELVSDEVEVSEANETSIEVSTDNKNDTYDVCQEFVESDVYYGICPTQEDGEGLASQDVCMGIDPNLQYTDPGQYSEAATKIPQDLAKKCFIESFN
jgi:hypothetical protein